MTKVKHGKRTERTLHAPTRNLGRHHLSGVRCRSVPLVGDTLKDQEKAERIAQLEAIAREIEDRIYNDQDALDEILDELRDLRPAARRRKTPFDAIIDRLEEREAERMLKPSFLASTVFHPCDDKDTITINVATRDRQLAPFIQEGDA